MGLLEQLLAKLDALTTRLDKLENGANIPVTITMDVSKTTPGVATAANDDNATDQPTVELDKNGIPWDERIHAGTKRKNADGTWSLKKGVDKDLVAQIIAEYRSAAPTAPAAPEKPSAPTATSAPVPPAPPAAPAKPGVPATPAKPGVPAAPAKPEEAGPTVKAARLSNTMINDMGVDYDLVIAGVLTPRGYDQFGSVPDEEVADVLKDLEKWEENLKNLVKEFADLRGMAEGTEHAQAVEEGLAYYVSNSDGEGDDPATIPFAKIYDTYVEVAKWSNEWEPVLAALKG